MDLSVRNYASYMDFTHAISNCDFNNLFIYDEGFAKLKLMLACHQRAF